MGEKWTLESAAREKAPGLHPSAGARLRVFLKHALLTPGLDPRTRYQRFIAWVGQMLRFPLSSIGKVKYNGAIHRRTLSKPPVFLIGHWRSGTTHQHKLMRRYLVDREKLKLPVPQFAETTCEKITSDPVGEIGRIYDQLGLGGKENGLNEIAAYVPTLKGYSRNLHRISPGHAVAIPQRWRFSFEAWGYDLEPPEDIFIG